jgi:hypothetical protein
MKKIPLVMSSISTVVCLALFLFAKSIKLSACAAREIGCWENYNLISILFLLGPALLIPSLIALRVSEETFKKWKKTTIYFILTYLLIVILMPWSVGDEFVGFTKGLVGLVLCIIYLVLSTVYLLIKGKK